MRIVAIRYTDESEQMAAFYTALGLNSDVASRTGDWVEFGAPHGTLALHAAGGGKPSGTVELSFEADERLEATKSRLENAGFPGAVIVDESHGRSLRIADPEGVTLQINESDPELFT